jgi:tyrosyl-tRNA synthetase
LALPISDELMWTYWELVTDRTEAWIAEIRKTVEEGTTHPMGVKMRLAQEIIGQFHGKEAAKQAEQNFQRVFRNREAPRQSRRFD